MHIDYGIIERKLYQTKEFNQLEICDIIKLLLFINETNYFQLNNNAYRQKYGMPMGPPLSSTLAEIMMQQIDNTVILTSSH